MVKLMKNLFRKHEYCYACTVLVAISLTAVAGCSQVPVKPKESPPKVSPPKVSPPTEIIIRGSV